MLDLEIRKKIADYAAGTIDAGELEAWLSGETWDVEDESPSTQRLAFEAMRLVSERSHGDWTDEQLREQLGALSRYYWFEAAPKTPKTAIPGSEAVLIRRGRWSAASDRSPAGASA
jgi:hypothetical protein